MANLIKIKKVTLYTALTEDAAECYEVLALLKSNNIPVNHLHWRDGEELSKVFDPLATWSFSSDGETTFQKTFTKVPIVHWESMYDNDNFLVNVAVGLDELQNSQLISEVDKVVGRTP